MHHEVTFIATFADRTPAIMVCDATAMDSRFGFLVLVLLFGEHRLSISGLFI